MSIERYEIFEKVVELRSSTKAADILGYTQSGVSHAINSIEKDFGFQLLERSRNGVSFTHNGAIMQDNLVLKQSNVPFSRNLGFGVLRNRNLSPALSVFKDYVIDYVNSTK